MVVLGGVFSYERGTPVKDYADFGEEREVRKRQPPGTIVGP